MILDENFMEVRLEQRIRVPFAGKHNDPNRRFIADVPAGIIHGRAVSSSNIFDLVAEPKIGAPGVDSRGMLVLGDHYHKTFDELFVLGKGKGFLSAQELFPQEDGSIRQGEYVEIPLNSEDPAQRLVYLPRLVAHRFTLQGGS